MIAEGWGHDVAVLLAGIAGRTSRIGLGSGVPNVWGRSPATIVMTAAGLDELDHVLETLRPGGEPVP